MDSINEIERFLGFDNREKHDGFICLLTGQFSSGKSRFINKLLGEDILPVGTREMTAVSTYIKRGSTNAFIYNGDIGKEIDIADIRNFKKGFCDCEKIEVSLEYLETPENLIFVDTPGTNSISFDKSEEDIKKADAILYFLTKGLTATDVEFIDDICRNKKLKLLFVRTRIDDIKSSEENILETYEEERAIIKSLYPSADFYFVSLDYDVHEINQVSELMSYVKYDLETELAQMREKLEIEYVLDTLCPALEKMKMEVSERSDNASSSQLLKKTQKQLKVIRKNVNLHEPEIRKSMEHAKENYIRNGGTYINRVLSSNGQITSKEIQVYVLECIKKFEEWYKLELEDIVSNIVAVGDPGVSQKLLSREVIDKVFVMYDKHKNRLAEASVLEQDNSETYGTCFEDISTASKYLKKIIESVFIKLDAKISDNFSERINGIIDDLSKQFEKEDEVIQRYILDEEETVKQINHYLLELKKYESSKESA